MYSSSRRGTHHIFFPPRLEVVVTKNEPNFLPTYPLNDATLDHFFGDEAHCPTTSTLGRRGADHRDDARLHRLRRCLGAPWWRTVIEHPRDAALLEPLSCATNGRFATTDCGRNIGRCPSVRQERKGPNPLENPDWNFACRCSGFELTAVREAQPDRFGIASRNSLDHRQFGSRSRSAVKTRSATRGHGTSQSP